MDCETTMAAQHALGMAMGFGISGCLIALLAIVLSVVAIRSS